MHIALAVLGYLICVPMFVILVRYSTIMVEVNIYVFQARLETLNETNNFVRNFKLYFTSAMIALVFVANLCAIYKIRKSSAGGNSSLAKVLKKLLGWMMVQLVFFALLL